MDFDSLYNRYVDHYSDQPRYLNGVASISEEDLYDSLGAEIDDIIEDVGALSEYAAPEDEGVILEIYNIAEAQFVFEELLSRRS
jgi:hypothetical protein